MIKKFSVLIIFLVFVFTIGCSQDQSPQTSKKNPEGGDPSRPGAFAVKIDLLKEITDEDKKEAKGFIEEGEKLANKSNFLKAREKFNMALEKNPKDMDAYRGLASVHRSLNDSSFAITVYNKALSMEPENPMIWALKAKTYFGDKKFADAAEAYKKAKELNDNDYIIYKYLAESYANMKQYDKAEETYNKAIKKLPDNFRVYEYYGSYWGRRGASESDKDRSVEMFQKSADWYKKAFDKLTDEDNFPRPRVLFRYAEAYYKKWKKTGNEKDKQMAVKLFITYRKLDKEHVWSFSADRMLIEMTEGR